MEVQAWQDSPVEKNGGDGGGGASGRGPVGKTKPKTKAKAKASGGGGLRKTTAVVKPKAGGGESVRKTTAAVKPKAKSKAKAAAEGTPVEKKGGEAAGKAKNGKGGKDVAGGAPVDKKGGEAAGEAKESKGGKGKGKGEAQQTGEVPPDPAEDPAGFLNWDPALISLKVALAREYVKSPGKQMGGGVLKELFLPSQMSKLWQIFDGKRRKESNESVASWDSLSEHKGKRHNIVAIKTKCLEVALLGNEKHGGWDDIVIEFKTSLED